MNCNQPNRRGNGNNGHWVRRNEGEPQHSLILFHTGAGPHDLFLLWKAAYLVAELDDCQVLIADVLSDATGWAWSSDRTQYQRVRSQLDEENRWRKRVEAAVEVALTGSSSLTAALGWCLGGRAIAEIAQLANPPRAMVTFHGVFPRDLPQEVNPISKIESEILVCHGVDDPFVPTADLESALSIFQRLGHRTSLLQLQAKHGFSNPAQEFNQNPAFAYDAEAASKSWRQAVALLRRVVAK